MKKIIIPAVTAIALGLSSAALAGAVGHTTTGEINSLDRNANTITLDDGNLYYLPHSYRNPALKEASKVTVTWNKRGNERTVNSIEIDDYDSDSDDGP